MLDLLQQRVNTSGNHSRLHQLPSQVSATTRLMQCSNDVSETSSLIGNYSQVYSCTCVTVLKAVHVLLFCWQLYAKVFSCHLWYLCLSCCAL